MRDDFSENFSSFLLSWWSSTFHYLCWTSRYIPRWLAVVIQGSFSRFWPSTKVLMTVIKVLQKALIGLGWEEMQICGILSTLLVGNLKHHSDGAKRFGIKDFRIGSHLIAVVKHLVCTTIIEFVQNSEEKFWLLGGDRTKPMYLNMGIALSEYQGIRLPINYLRNMHNNSNRISFQTKNLLFQTFISLNSIYLPASTILVLPHLNMLLIEKPIQI